MDYYELLGVGENASQPEIKRAYFGKIKQFTPENAPEMFKQIREAYDCLRDEEKRKQYTKILKSPSIPALTQAREAMKLKNFKKAIELLKKADKAFPESEVIKEALATAYEENDSTGNAIKVYEELVMQCPSNQDFALALARNYEKRGYTKKAWDQFNKAVKINPNNPDAWGEWFHTCHHADVSSLAKIIYEAETISEDIFEKNYGVYIQLWMKLNPRNHLNDEFQLKHYDVFRKFLMYCKKDRFPGKENIFILLDFLMYILHASNADMELINDGLQIVEKNLDSENKEHYEHLKIAYAMHQLRSDTKINNALHDLTVTALQRNEPDNLFDKTDEYEYKMIQAYILVHLTTLKDSILYFKENYLSLYSLNQSFFEQLENLEKIRRLENSLKKQMKIIRENPDLFLDTQPNLDPLDSFDETPVRRSAPKVGRNDPCPCGSGKKYKHCCGR